MMVIQQVKIIITIKANSTVKFRITNEIIPIYKTVVWQICKKIYKELIYYYT